MNGVRRVLDAAVAAGATRFVQISSCAAFGKQFPAGPTETYPWRPRPGATTTMRRAAASTWRSRRTPRARSRTIVRPETSTARARARRLIPLEAIAQGRLVLPDHGRGILSPVFIDDLVDGIVLAARCPPRRATSST